MAYVAIAAILVLSCGCAADALRAADIVGLYDPSERAETADEIVKSTLASTVFNPETNEWELFVTEWPKPDSCLTPPELGSYWAFEMREGFENFIAVRPIDRAAYDADGTIMTSQNWGGEIDGELKPISQWILCYIMPSNRLGCADTDDSGRREFTPVLDGDGRVTGMINHYFEAGRALSSVAADDDDSHNDFHPVVTQYSMRRITDSVDTMRTAPADDCSA